MMAALVDKLGRGEAYLNWLGGREQITDGGYRFFNKSKATAYGIMSQVDGDALTIASLEETDDMPQQRLLSNVLPMLGGARRLGAPEGLRFPPVTLEIFTNMETAWEHDNSGSQPLREGSC